MDVSESDLVIINCKAGIFSLLSQLACVFLGGLPVFGAGTPDIRFADLCEIFRGKRPVKSEITVGKDVERR